MSGFYSIEVLPPDSLLEIPEESFRRKKGLMQIKENTFSNIPRKLNIRPKSVRFAENAYRQHSRVYAVIYRNVLQKECLFLFKFTYHWSVKDKDYKTALYMSRAVGKRLVKKHWEPVKKLILENEEKIHKLKKWEELGFPIE